ncbi:MAG: hypothetical protein ACRBDL_05070 [Alphaproteobacteria bacterium]
MTSEHVEDGGKETGSLIDFVYGVTDESKLQIEVAVKDDGRCAVFYNKPFKNELSWLEFDLETCRLDFVLDDGEIRNIGMPLTNNMAKNMQNTHQMLMVLMDDETGNAKEGVYIPLIIHRN